MVDVSGCVLKHNADRTTQNFNTKTVVTFNSNVYDTDSFHAGTDGKITIPVRHTGKFGIFTAFICLSAVGGAGYQRVLLLRNGVECYGGAARYYNGLAGAGTGQDGSGQWLGFVTPPILLNATDYFELEIRVLDSSVTLKQESTFGLYVMENTAVTQKCLCAGTDQTTKNYSTPTALTWPGTDVYDADNAHDPVTNNDSIIIPSAWNGKWGVVYGNSALSLGTNNTGESGFITKNGSFTYDGCSGNSGECGPTSSYLPYAQTQVIQFATGDVFKFVQYCQDTSVTFSGTSTASFFGAYVLGDQLYGASTTLTPGLVVDDDTIYAPTALKSDYPLTPGLVTDTDAFFAPAVLPGAVTIQPPLVTDADTVFSATIPPQDQLLQPDIVADTDQFYSADITIQGIFLQPSLVVDDDQFYAVTVTSEAVTLLPGLVEDVDEFLAPTISSGIIISHDIGRVIDQDIIYAPTSTSISYLQPPLVTDAFEQIIAPAVVNVWQLLPGLVVDFDNIFVGPAVIPGPVTLKPALVNDPDTIWIPFVSRTGTTGGGGGGGGGGNVSKDIKYGSSLVMAQSGQIIMLGANIAAAKTGVTTRMMVYADQGGQPGALLGKSADKQDVVAGDNFYNLLVPVGRTAGQTIWVALHSNATNINWALANSKAGSRFNNDLFSDGPSDPFGASSIDNKKAPVFAVYMESAPVTLSPQKVTDADTFLGTASITTSNTLTPSFVIPDDSIWAPSAQAINYVLPDIVADYEEIFAPSASASYSLLPGLVIDSDIVLDPAINTIAPPGQQLTTPVFTDEDSFYPPEVIPQGAVLAVPLFEDADEIFPPGAQAYNELFVDDFLNDLDDIPSPEVTNFNTVEPLLWEDQDQFYETVVEVSAQDQFLQPELYEDEDVFLPPFMQQATMRRTVSILGQRDSAAQLIGDRTSAATILGERESPGDIEGEG